MAQNRVRDFKEPVTSFLHNLFNLGLHNPGRYCGFDTGDQGLSALKLIIKHTQTGIIYKDQTNTQKGPFGLICTPQGVLITEDADLAALDVDTNAGNPQIRYDLIVMNHEFLSIAGGGAATYSIIKGPINNPIKPILADPYLQTVIGTLEIPSGATQVSQMKYVKAKCPDSGDGEDARLYEPNIFSHYQGLNQTDDCIISDSKTTGAHIAKLWTFGNDGNQFKLPAGAANVDAMLIKGVPLQQGMRACILMTSDHTLRESRFFEADSTLTAKGYRGFVINSGLGNFTIPASQNGGGSQFGIRPSVSETWEIEVVYVNNYWLVVSIGGAGSQDQFKRGMMMEWYGDVATNFDASGKGINLMNGYHLCNGNMGTPDRRGKVSVMATDVPASGRPVLTEEQVLIDGGDPDDYIFGNTYTLQGKRKVLIVQDNLPSATLFPLDPGHRHFTLNNFSGEAGDPNAANSVNKSANLGGNPTYRMQGTNTEATIGRSSIGITGITVPLGGDDEPLEIIFPQFMTVVIMKL